MAWRAAGDEWPGVGAVVPRGQCLSVSCVPALGCLRGTSGWLVPHLQGFHRISSLALCLLSGPQSAGLQRLENLPLDLQSSLVQEALLCIGKLRDSVPQCPHWQNRDNCSSCIGGCSMTVKATRRLRKTLGGLTQQTLVQLPWGGGSQTFFLACMLLLKSKCALC